MRLRAWAFLGLWALTAPATALAQGSGAGGGETGKVRAVLELFTSQGCSSCPAADALFEGYAKRTDLVALTMPVDYWDYLGWKDTLAQHKFSDRQRAYAKERGDGHVYTPQIVVSGRSHVVGSNAGEIDRAITRSQAAFLAMQPPIRAELGAGELVIEIGGAPAVADLGSNTVWLAVVEPRVEVAIRKGENTGRKLVYFNVVRELVPVGRWDGGQRTLRLDSRAVTSVAGERCAVLIQSGSNGAIVGAAWATGR